MQPKEVVAPAGGKLLVPGMARTGDRPYDPIPPGEWLIGYLRSVSVRTRKDMNTWERYDSRAFWDWIQKHNKEVSEELQRKDLDDYMEDTVPEALRIMRGKRYFIPKRTPLLDGLGVPTDGFV
jgi:hypothetical protein